MKFNISYPLTGGQKCIEIDDDKKCNVFMDKKMGQEVEGDTLGDEFKGYVFKIAGGNDKQGFPMKQGVMVKGRVRLLLSEGHSCFTVRRSGFRKRKSVRGSIVGPDIRVLALQVVKKGDNEIDGVTTVNLPRVRGPKRANNIRKLFGLEKTDNRILVQKSVIRKTFKTAAGKDRHKSTKIQRLVTPERLRRKRALANEIKKRHESAKASKEEYEKFLGEWKKSKTAAAQKAVAATLAAAEEKKKADAKVAAAKPTKAVASKTPAPAAKVATTAPAKTAAKTTPAPAAKTTTPAAKTDAKKTGKK